MSEITQESLIHHMKSRKYFLFQFFDGEVEGILSFITDEERSCYCNAIYDSSLLLDAGERLYCRFPKYLSGDDLEKVRNHLIEEGYSVERIKAILSEEER